MPSIADAFAKVKKENRRGAFIPYFIAGYPDIETSFNIIKEAAPFSDIIEIGVPFSDPIADGRVIQEGVNRALKKTVSLESIFKHTEKLISEIDCPVVYMIYFNQVFSYGIERFIKKIKDIGVSGLIIPDLLPDGEPEINEIASRYGINIIFFISPTTTDSRIDKLIDKYQGFIYLIAVTGVTGVRKEINMNIKCLTEKIRKKTDLPICIGFGISSKKHIKEIYSFADGAIVGSAIIQEIIDSKNKINITHNVIKKIKELIILT